MPSQERLRPKKKLSRLRKAILLQQEMRRAKRREAEARRAATAAVPGTAPVPTPEVASEPSHAGASAIQDGTAASTGAPSAQATVDNANGKAKSAGPAARDLAEPDGETPATADKVAAQEATAPPETGHTVTSAKVAAAAAAAAAASASSADAATSVPTANGPGESRYVLAPPALPTRNLDWCSCSPHASCAPPPPSPFHSSQFLPAARPRRA